MGLTGFALTVRLLLFVYLQRNAMYVQFHSFLKHCHGLPGFQWQHYHLFVIKLFDYSRRCNANCNLNFISTTSSSNISCEVPKNNCAQVSRLCRKGLLKEALAMLNDMSMAVPVLAAEKEMEHLYACVLQACTDAKAIAEGKETHAHIRSNGFDKKPILQAQLVSMYTIFGNMLDARSVFDKMPKPNVFLWNAVIRGYASKGLYDEALAVFHKMLVARVQMDHHTFPCLLKACAGLSALQLGKGLHGCIIKRGFESDVFVGNALVAKYAKCACIHDARQVFDHIRQRNLVSWNSMIAGYVQLGYCTESLQLFRQMELEHLNPCSMTIASVLPACANLGDLLRGKEIHAYITRNRFELDVFVGSTLIDMYAKCNSTGDSRQVFDSMSQRDVVCWNAMITGYVQTGHCDEALRLFCKMQRTNLIPTSVTIAALLPACSHLTALRHGKQIHDYAIRCRFDSNDFVGSAIIDMYAKCGVVEIARKIFDKLSQRDVVSWTTMIMGYAMHGFGADALILFHQMQQACMKPNHVTLIAVLTACSHSGMTDEAWQYFNSMRRDYLIVPTVEHYACMVDLLGRAGRLAEAYDFIKSMPVEPDAGVWGALLGACRVHCNTDLGKEVAGYVFELEPGNAGYYVLLSNIYAAAGCWNDVSKLKLMLKDRGMKKNPAFSWIEVKNSVHAFLTEDRSHPQSEKIYAKLDSLYEQMKVAGYVPDTNCVLHGLQGGAE